MTERTCANIYVQLLPMALGLCSMSTIKINREISSGNSFFWPQLQKKTSFIPLLAVAQKKSFVLLGLYVFPVSYKHMLS